MTNHRELQAHKDRQLKKEMDGIERDFAEFNQKLDELKSLAAKLDLKIIVRERKRRTVT